MTVVLLALILPLGALAHATEEEEEALIEQAEAQLDVVLNPSASKKARTAALRKLQDVRNKIRAYVAADAKFTRRSDTDPFRMLHDGLDEFLAEQARELGVDLGAKERERPAASTPNAERRGVPLPDYSKGPERLRLAAAAVSEACKKLDSIRAEPEGESLAATAAQRNRRDRALEELVLNQVRLVWEASEQSTDKLERIALLQARERFLVHLETRRDAAAKEDELLKRLAKIHRLFNKAKREAAGGKITPALMLLDADARRVIKSIMRLRATSNKAYFAYVAVAEPMEDAARALFRKRLQAGEAQINFKLKQQGHKGPPFRLFRPKTGNERRLLDRIVGAWLIRELGILGAVEGRGDWVPFELFSDFDFETGCAGSASSKKPPPCPAWMTGPGGERWCIASKQVIYGPPDGDLAHAIWTLTLPDGSPVAAGPEIAIVAQVSRADGSPVGRGKHTYSGSRVEQGGRLVFHWSLSAAYRVKATPVGASGEAATLTIQPAGSR